MAIREPLREDVAISLEVIRARDLYAHVTLAEADCFIIGYAQERTKAFGLYQTVSVRHVAPAQC